MPRDNDELTGVITVNGTPGMGIPAATVLTTTRGEMVVTEQAVCIGQDGTVQVPVRRSTSADVVAFQKAKGLTEDGIFGPKTRAKVHVFMTRYDLIRSDDWLGIED